MSEWIEWGGGSQPVPDNARVEVRLRDGSESESLAGSYYWACDLDFSDIVAYRVVGKADQKADDGGIGWDGGACPVSAGTVVRAYSPLGFLGQDYAENFNWLDRSRSGIVRYKVIEPWRAAVKKEPAGSNTKAEETKVFTAASSESIVTVKPSNPKDIVGIRKAPMSTVSAPVLAEIGVGMLEGAAKYGRHNYRIVGVRSSVYYDATMRHLMSWWEGEDIDPESGMSHITKAITSLVVLRDSQIQGTVTDDRAPRSAEFYPALNKLAGEIIDRHAEKSPRHYTIADEVTK